MEYDRPNDVNVSKYLISYREPIVVTLENLVVKRSHAWR